MVSRRRGNGEGSIYQRNDGTWCATYSAGYDTKGKRKRHTIFANTRDGVRDKLTKVLSTRLDTPEFKPSRLKMSQYLERWLEDASRPTIRITTYQSYKGVIRNHMNCRIGGVTLTNLAPTHVQAMYADMERRGVGPRVRQLTHAVLHRALKQAMRWGLVTRNVCDAVDPPRIKRSEMMTLTPEQAVKFLDEAKRERLAAVFVLAITTGMRMGELFALKWCNVYLDRGVLQVRHTLIECGGQLILSEPKTDRSRRSVELPQIAIDALRQHRKQTEAEGLGDSPWVFCNFHGGPLRRTHFHADVFKPMLAAMDLPPIRFHDLRHTSATLLLSVGVHPKVVQERLGHSQIAITLDTYSHVLPTLQREAAAKFDEMLTGKGA